MRVVRTLLVLVLVLVIASSAMAAGGKGKGKGKAKKPPKPEQPAINVLAMLKGVTLTDEQKRKAEALQNEYAPKVGAAQRKVRDLLTKEQWKARAEAQKAAKAAGKKGKEAQDAVDAAAKLTDEQKKALAAAEQDVNALKKDVRQKAMAILTPQQQDELKKASPAKGGKKGK